MDKTEQMNSKNGLEIAIIGMSGKFPGAKNITALWQNLEKGTETISFFSDDELGQAGIEPELFTNVNYIKARGILPDIYCFDAFFFDYTPNEAETLDPQVRLFHECAYEALEDSGYPPASYDGLIGVFAGANANLYWEAKVLSVRASMEDFSNKDFLCSRLSYKLNLKGPSYTVHTACSTSLVAVHLACRSLMGGECDLAVAGGVSVYTPQERGYHYQKEMIHSSDGHNRSFDEKATGTVFSSGIGIVVLKPLEDAIKDNDHIYVVIKGSAANNDGNRKVSFTAPSVKGQVEAIKAAMQVAEVPPESILYVEAHGSATDIGDPIEVKALAQAYKSHMKGYCGIGSIKSNLGHLNAAAGIAGLIKAVLILKNKKIPPGVHFENPNPKIDLENSPFYIVNRLVDLNNDNYPLRAGVNSLGLGGTNAHVILEEWRPEGEKGSMGREYKLITLSAKTRSSLEKMSEQLVYYLKERMNHPQHSIHPDNPGLSPAIDLADIAYTLQVGRGMFQHRRMFVCPGVEEVITALSKDAAGGVETYYREEEKERPVIFMFPGQGPQYVNVGLDLYRSEPFFRTEVNRCFEILKSQTGKDIKKILYPDDNLSGDVQFRELEEEINLPENAQPVLFIVGYAMAGLLKTWGIEPYAMIGHSFGEYIAACLSGVFPLEDALKLAVLRGRLMQRAGEGAMISVPLAVEDVKPFLNDEISLAAVNAPSLCILSGPVKAISDIEGKLKEKKCECLRLKFPGGGHSCLMEPILNEFERGVGKITLKNPQIPYISGLTGEWITIEQAVNPGYWARHLRDTILFSTGTKELLKIANAIFVQVGPGRGLSLFVKQQLEDETGNPVLNLFRHPKDKVSDVFFLLSKIGQLWSYGVEIDWHAFYAHEKRLRVSLPTYPFEKTHYWFAGDPLKKEAGDIKKDIILKNKIISDWFYVPSWKQSDLIISHRKKKQKQTNILVFIDKYGVGSRLIEQLGKEGNDVISVKAGNNYSVLNHDKGYIINPREEGDYHKLFTGLLDSNKTPGHIIHLWGVTKVDREKLSIEGVSGYLDTGFYSLLYIAKELGKRGVFEGVNIHVILNNQFEVTGDEELCPGISAVLGAIKVIPQEFPGMKCRAVDIALPVRGIPIDHKIISQLLREITDESADTDAIVCYRGNHRWVQIFEAKQLKKPETTKSGLRERGVYLLTGGLGKIGFVLAGYLARSVKARLILTGRSYFPSRGDWDGWLEKHEKDDPTSRKICEIQKLEELGAEVLVFSADTADKGKMQEVILQAEAQFGNINGVIHCAGIVEGNLISISDTNRDASEAQFSAKIYGTLVLAELLTGKNIDFCILMSSLAAVLGGLGHIAYSSANAFLDSFSHWQNRENRSPWLSVNWDGWQFSGIESRDDAGTTGPESFRMSLEEEIIAFEIVLSLRGIGQVAVSPGDLQRRMNKWIKLEHLHKDDPVGRWHDNKPSHPRPGISSVYAAPRDQIEDKISNIWKGLFGFAQVGIDDNYFELGGDSYLLITAIARIHKELDIEISVKEFYSNSSIRKLAALIRGKKKQEFVFITHTEKKEYYPVSSAQRRIYFIQQVDPESVAYNITFVFELTGIIEKDKYERIFKKLLKRHEMLRASFEVVGGEIVQEIHDEVEFEIEGCEKVEDIKAKILNFKKPFNLSLSPLLRVGLIHMEESVNILMIDIHHIISDARSIEILRGDFIAMYYEVELPVLRLRYRDFSAWENRFIESEENMNQGKYWLDRFSGGLPLLKLPSDYQKQDVREFAAEHVNFIIDGELFINVKQVMNETGTTLYMLLLSVFTILLYKYTGQEDIIIGTPISGRDYYELENIIGVFVNMLAMRNKPTGAMTFGKFVEQVKENTLEAFDNQNFQFDELTKRLGLYKDSVENPLTEAVFNLFRREDDINDLISRNASSDPEVFSYQFEDTRTPFNLLLNAVESTTAVELKFTYATDLFKKETLEKMSQHYIEIVKQVTVDCDILLSNIKISLDIKTIKPTPLRGVENTFKF